MKNRIAFATPQILLSVFLAGALVGCATSDGPGRDKSFDAGARERAKPYLKDLVSYDFRFSSPKGTCGPLEADADWKDFVWAAGACRAELMKRRTRARQKAAELRRNHWEQVPLPSSTSLT